MTLNKRMLPAATLALALMGPHAGSQAGTVTTQHGSGCKSYGWSSSAEAYPTERGVVALIPPESLSVVCPVTRVGPVSSGGLRVWIDGRAPTGSVVTCALWSFNYNGLLLASQSFEVTGAGFDAPFDRYLDLAAASVPTYSSQVVTCTLPHAGEIFDIEPFSL
jgi:hypothetical protein